MANQLKDFYNYLKKIKGLSDRTIMHYLSYHRHFMKLKLSQKNITTFITKKNNNSVCRGYMMAWLEFLKKDKIFEIPKVKTGTTKKRIVKQISKYDMNKIIECAYDHSKKDGIMIDLLYWGALRRSEIGTIMINSIDWDGWFKDPNDLCEFNVTGKGKRDRTVVVHPRAIKTILKFFFKNEIISISMQPNEILEKLNSLDELLFRSLSERVIYEKVKNYALKTLKRPVRTHEVRHCRATHLEEDGASIRDIQKYLGHSNMATTEIYLHASEGESLRRIKEIGKDL